MMRAHLRGLSLVELLVSIVIVSVAVVSVLGALSAVATNSARTMLQQQSSTIASAYLNEVLQKSFADPDGSGVEASRGLYDDVRDYNGLDDNGARDQFGNALVGLEQYRVQVTVGAGSLPGLAAAQVRRVDVTVTHPSMPTVKLSGYRTQY